MPPDPIQRPLSPSDAASDAERLAQLEARLARIEAHLGLAADESGMGVSPGSGGAEQTHGRDARATTEPSEIAPLTMAQTEDELEFEVGQNWFAVVGILALTLGGAFMLSLPYANLPAGVPSVVGFAGTVAAFVLAHRCRRTFDVVARYLHAAGMVLLFVATLRLFFFGAQHVLDTGTLGGRAVLVAVVAIEFVIAFRRDSAWLVALALLTGFATALAVGSAWFVLAVLALLAGLAVSVSLRRNWPGLVLAGMGLSYAAYLIWAIGNPLLGGAVHFTTEPWAGPAILLVCAVVFSIAPLFRPVTANEGMAPLVAALNCMFGYGLFVVHTAAAFPAGFAAAQLVASALLLGIAVAFWLRQHSQWSTFVYAMTGYAALSLAIIKLSVVPVVFVWLSVQSVVVVATAIWFRSRFIVVANFLIYVSIVLAYVVLLEKETGISLGFGIVALVTARILHWQQHRLELKTELMRNACLLSAFVVFPYALAHLVPSKQVGLAWVGLAVVYYVLNLIVRSQKYRWMGHATLLLTSVYVVTVGTRQLGPVYRIASFLVLGTVLLVVSLVFTRLRQRAKTAKGAGP